MLVLGNGWQSTCSGCSCQTADIVSAFNAHDDYIECDGNPFVLYVNAEENVKEYGPMRMANSFEDFNAQFVFNTDGTVSVVATQSRVKSSLITCWT